MGSRDLNTYQYSTTNVLGCSKKLHYSSGLQFPYQQDKIISNAPLILKVWDFLLVDFYSKRHFCYCFLLSVTFLRLTQLKC